MVRLLRPGMHLYARIVIAQKGAYIMLKSTIAAILCLSSLAAYADTLVIQGSPMDTIQSRANSEDLLREVAGINPALVKAFLANHD